MIYFPPLMGGVVTQFPFTGAFNFRNDVNDLPSGHRYAYAWHGGGLSLLPTGPLARWEVTFSRLPTAGRDILNSFFAARKGRLESFAWLDPSGNLVAQSENFANAAWIGGGASPGAADPIGGTNAFSTSATTLTTLLLPDGDALGITLCASVWLKGQDATLQLATGAGSVWAAKDFTGSTSWQRVALSATVPNFASVQLRIVTSGGGAIFGAMVAPTPGPGNYVRNPGNPCLFPNCRFASDELLIRTVAPNHHQTSFAIEEFHN